MNTDQQALLDVWFGPPDASDHAIASRQSSLWWRKDADTDTMLARRFGALVDQAARGRLNHWSATPVGVLALLLLTDQLRRNLYRDSPDAFAMDDLARGLTRQSLLAGTDRALRPIHRVFVYMPMQHSESLIDQDTSVSLFAALAGDQPATARPPFDKFLGFARAHRDVIRRFGRFPHRNAVLGRANTPAEVDYLAQPGAGF